MTALRTAAAFLRKDFLEEVSYRMRLLLEFVTMAIGIFFLVVFSEFISVTVAEKFGTLNYLAFALVGLAFNSLHQTSLNEFTRKIRAAQTLGTLEALLSTRTSVFTLMACLPLYPVLRSSATLLLYLLVGYVFLAVPIQWGNWPACALVFLASMVVFGSLGLAFAALTVVFKRTESVIQTFNMLCFLASGVFIPVDKLPEWLQEAAQLFPLTPALQGFRQTILHDASLLDIWPSLVHLLIFVCILLPLSLMSFRWAVRKAMLDGSLTQY
ncbi:MAG: ABC transporter permease [Planctomycetota bacterium]